MAFIREFLIRIIAWPIIILIAAVSITCSLLKFMVTFPLRLVLFLAYMAYRASKRTLPRGPKPPR